MPLPSYSDIVDLIKKGATVEAQEKIVALREAALELQEENLALKARVRELDEQLATKKRLSFDGAMYWLSGDNGKEGPFCQKCYDANKNLVRLQKRSMDDGGHYFRCFQCTNNYDPVRA